MNTLFKTETSIIRMSKDKGFKELKSKNKMLWLKRQIK